jgi:hypothetical protein
LSGGTLQAFLPLRRAEHHPFQFRHHRLMPSLDLIE